jgi:hypothetical protein
VQIAVGLEIQEHTATSFRSAWVARTIELVAGQPYTIQYIIGSSTSENSPKYVSGDGLLPLIEAQKTTKNPNVAMFYNGLDLAFLKVEYANYGDLPLIDFKDQYDYDNDPSVGDTSTQPPTPANIHTTTGATSIEIIAPADALNTVKRLYFNFGYVPFSKLAHTSWSKEGLLGVGIPAPDKDAVGNDEAPDTTIPMWIIRNGLNDTLQTLRNPINGSPVTNFGSDYEYYIAIKGSKSNLSGGGYASDVTIPNPNGGIRVSVIGN